MTERRDRQRPGIEEDHELAEPPHTVWRALVDPRFRDRWLPAGDLASPDPASVTPGREISYTLRESDPPFLESTVTFRIRPREGGGTHLRIVHELADARSNRSAIAPANANGPRMRAA